MASISLAISAPLIVYGVAARIGANDAVGPFFGFTEQLPLRNITFLIGCAVGSLAVLATLHLLHERLSASARQPIEAVGRMALTNYILQSAAMLFVFHFFHAAPFDQLDHDALFAIVVAMWVFHVAFSSIWLSRFAQGPLEFALRSLASRLGGRKGITASG